jgi:hypothetical protein
MTLSAALNTATGIQSRPVPTMAAALTPVTP